MGATMGQRAEDRLKIVYVDKAELRLTEEDGAGYVSGYAALWDTPDSDGDVFRRGAFAKTIRERLAAGKVSLRSTHWLDNQSIFENIGVLEEGREDDRGFWIKAKLYSKDKAQEARLMVKEAPKVWGFSTSGRTLATEDFNAHGGRDLLEVALREVTLTDCPLHEGTRGIKAAAESVSHADKAPHTALTADRLRREQIVRQLTVEELEA